DRESTLATEVLHRYLPDVVVAISSDVAVDSQVVSFLAERIQIGGKPTAYVCRDHVCERPVTTTEELAILL
ncbi:MAG: hypothetical protein ABL959_16020, partial [Pyrinomonadaceae bacterium]